MCDTRTSFVSRGRRLATRCVQDVPWIRVVWTAICDSAKLCSPRQFRGLPPAFVGSQTFSVAGSRKRAGTIVSQLARFKENVGTRSHRCDTRCWGQISSRARVGELVRGFCDWNSRDSAPALRLTFVSALRQQVGPLLVMIFRLKTYFLLKKPLD